MKIVEAFESVLSRIPEDGRKVLIRRDSGNSWVGDRGDAMQQVQKQVLKKYGEEVDLSFVSVREGVYTFYLSPRAGWGTESVLIADCVDACEYVYEYVYVATKAYEEERSLGSCPFPPAYSARAYREGRIGRKVSPFHEGGMSGEVQSVLRREPLGEPGRDIAEHLDAIGLGASPVIVREMDAYGMEYWSYADTLEGYIRQRRGSGLESALGYRRRRQRYVSVPLRKWGRCDWRVEYTLWRIGITEPFFHMKAGVPVSVTVYPLAEEDGLIGAAVEVLYPLRGTRKEFVLEQLPPEWKTKLEAAMGYVVVAGTAV